MAAVLHQSSADSLLSLLNEDDQALKLYALQSLNQVVHDFWYQIASSIALVEAFYEDEDFVHRELAALVASKVSIIRDCLLQTCVASWAELLAWLRMYGRLVISEAFVLSRTARFQVFYHLGELDDALQYALGAGSLFDLTENSEYVQTLLGTSIAERSAVNPMSSLHDHHLISSGRCLTNVLLQPVVWTCIRRHE